MPVANAGSRITDHGSGRRETEAVQVLSPAKVNLYLGVTGTRPDGYHELATLFERIELADELSFAPQEEGILCTCDHPAVPRDDENLVVRAARLVQVRCGVAHGVHITLRKRIPIAAGLGGGSSNAATVLLTLNNLWQLGLSRETLLALGRELGADVPFFLTQTPFALGVSRGDVVVPVPTDSFTLWHVLVTPPVALLSANVFRAWDALGSSAGAANITQLARLLSALVERDAEQACGLTWNHLLPAARRLAPIIEDVECVLVEAGARTISLTGSGPTVFATLTAQPEAEALAAHVRQARPTWQVVLTHTSESCDRWGVV